MNKKNITIPLIAIGLSLHAYSQKISWKNKIEEFHIDETVELDLQYDTRPLSFFYIDAKLLEIDKEGNVINTYDNSKPILKLNKDMYSGSINFQYQIKANTPIKQKLPEGHFYKLTTFMILNNDSEFEYKSDDAIVKLLN